MVARQATNSATQKILVKGEEGFVDLEDVVVSVENEVFHDEVEFAGMGQGEARPLQKLFRILQIQLQSDGEGQHGGLAGFVVEVVPDFGKELAVDVCLFLALGVRHSALVDKP